jgi:hypothetical protein
MKQSSLMIMAGALFFAAAAFSYFGGKTAVGATFLPLGVVFVALGAAKRKSKDDGNVG